MNNLSQILISATVGSLVTLAITVSPIVAQNRTATPTTTPPSNSTGEMRDQQQMMSDMHQMMEKCKSKMSSHNNPTGTQHNQHHPNNPNSNSNLSERSLKSKSKTI